MNILAPEDCEFYYHTYYKKLYCVAITEVYVTDCVDLFEASLKAHNFAYHTKDSFTTWAVSSHTVSTYKQRMSIDIGNYTLIEVSHV